MMNKADFDLIISNGKIVLPDKIVNGDLAVAKGKIAAIMPANSGYSANKVINAFNKYVVPGGIDAHTHIYHEYGNFRTNDTFETGTMAAAFGGTTTIIDFAVQKKGESALAAIEKRKKEIAGKAVVDYALHSCLTDGSDSTISEIEEIVKNGIASFKIYMTYRKEGQMVDDGALLAILKEARKCGGLVGVHAENAAISEYLADKFVEQGLTAPKYHALSTPNIVEAEAVNRAIYLARSTGTALYVYHLSTKEGVELVRAARLKGMQIYAETCSHYLLLTDQVYEEPHPENYLVSPPLRKKDDQTALWSGLKDQTISVIASDGIALDSKHKKKSKVFTEIPKGLAGVETRFPLLWSEGVAKGRLTPEEFVRIVASNPAKIFGLYPTKGCLLPGSDADIVVIDPEKRSKLSPENLHMKVDYSIYDGMECIGYPIITICRGKILVEQEKFVGQIGYGNFVSAKIEPELLHYG